MSIEIFINILIVATAGYIIYNNLKTMSSGDCGCGNSSSKQRINKNQ